ncbi:protein kinase domain-containing protein [Tundrisphaera sp. TA3]|uniref:serine/threonine-protein kinase n=1 Tax=Tundrisphaera sp. TA3 TaxID=3435775 RepID=UPI003EBB63D3
MPDFDPTPRSGPLGAQGSGRLPGPNAPGPPRGDGDDPPTVRSGSAHGSKLSRPGPKPAALPLPEPGERIDDFALEESIGAGGMGAVYRAADIKLDRYVALKILPPDQAVDPEVVQRYYQEGRAAARLDHENIARVYTIGYDGRYHFIAFEYIEGTTIRQVVEGRGPFTTEGAINLTLQIAGALVHASSRGVVHRDIKPSNIIVTPQGRAKLVDMGLARRFERDDETGLTQSGMTLGTFDYISPEQARDPRDVDIRSDLYSLGCTLFHMLSGQPPFPEGTVTQKLLNHQKDAPPDIQLLNPSVPDGLASILVKLMAKDRDRRYQTPEQLARDLLALAGSLGLRPSSPEGITWSPPAPTPAWQRHVPGGVVVVAFAMILGALAWWGDGTGPTMPVIETVSPPVPRPIPVVATQKVPAREAEPPRDIAVRPGDDLLRVLAEAPRRATILLVEDGPYELRPGPGRKLPGIDVSIKADAGVRPVVRLAADGMVALAGAASPALIEVANGKLAVDGVTFVVENEDLAAIRAEETDLTVRRCSFLRPSASANPRGRPAAIQARGGAKSGTSGERVPTILADACFFAGGQASILAMGPVDLNVRDCELGPAPSSLANFWCDNPDPGGAGSVAVDLRMLHVSVLAGAGPVFRFSGTSPRVRLLNSVVGPPGASPATLVTIDNPERLDWWGQDNVYARVGSYLQPAIVGADRLPIRSFAGWADDPEVFREAGSLPADLHPWDDPDPMATLAGGPADPARAFRLALPREAPHRAGARQGPAGPLPAPTVMAVAALPAARSDRGGDEVIAEPPPPVPSPSSPPPPRTFPQEPEEEEVPMPIPMPIPMPAPNGSRTAPAGRPAEIVEGEARPDLAPAPVAPPAAPPGPGPLNPLTWPVEPAGNGGGSGGPNAVLRTPVQFMDALTRSTTGTRTLIIASDADWSLPAIRFPANTSWVIRAEAGPTRPQIRFRPDPAYITGAWDWPAFATIVSGAVQWEGIDILLAAGDAPLPGRWAAFDLRSGGAKLELVSCTVTIEGTRARSAVIAASSGDDPPAVGVPAPFAVVPAGSIPARVRIKECLLRSGQDLVDIAAGCPLELKIEDAAVFTGGSLIHGHGLPDGRTTGLIRLEMSRTTSRAGGGTIFLESKPGDPELPIVDVDARDSILTTGDPSLPLIRVIGQEDLDQLADLIRWQARGVAYHRVSVYRRDDASRPDGMPRLLNRASWSQSVGRAEEAAIHGDLKFVNDASTNRAAWTMSRDDLRLDPSSPAFAAGPDLRHIPDPLDSREM